MTDTKDLQVITDLRQDPDNANLGTERGLHILDDSLTECGAGRSVLVDSQGTVVAGNKSVQVAADKGFPIRVVKTNGTELVVVQRTDLDLGGEGDEQRRARRLAIFDNRSSEVGLSWSAEQILALVEADDALLDGLFDDDELTELLAGLMEEGPALEEQARATLAERFIVPPFSVLDARQGYWQERKRAWIALGIQSEIGRGGGSSQIQESGQANEIPERERERESKDANGNAQRPDATKAPVRGYARCFRQDLMRGEHTVGE